ncbi:MAG: amidohydrolase [Verrucomicrobia bacterium]|nr:amidohydrolase [Verrucomicrobiota bacterium]MDA1066149.1 amidohydrolase [Verrucomicrobiota bacterium]
MTIFRFSIKNFTLLSSLFCLIHTVSAQGIKSKLETSIDSYASEYADTAQKIWELAELGYLENESSGLLKSKAEAAGFRIESGVAGIPTAFVATYGSGIPVIGIMGEFDALPGLSQNATTERDPRIEGAAGHACGHHLFGTASLAAAIAIKEQIELGKLKGTIRLYGTPAEEGGSGKVYMGRAGLYDDVDVMLHWHPSDQNNASPQSSNANKSAKFRFYGVAAHAASAPEKGKSALDGVEAMNYMANLMREHVPETTRIHYVITSGGEAPNVVPEFAEVFYYIRHPDYKVVRELFERLVLTAEGAALGTGTTMKYEVIHGNYDVLPNQALAKLMDTNLRTVGGVHYSKEETVFAKDLYETLVQPSRTIGSEKEIAEYKLSSTRGSTDVGDVSWLVPTTGLGTATWVPGTSAHTWQAVSAGGTSIGHKGMINAAKTLAMTAADLFQDPNLIKKARTEWNEARGKDFDYYPLLGDRDPPLDYRK